MIYILKEKENSLLLIHVSFVTQTVCEVNKKLQRNVYSDKYSLTYQMFIMILKENILHSKGFILNVI